MLLLLHELAGQVAVERRFEELRRDLILPGRVPTEIRAETVPLPPEPPVGERLGALQPFAGFGVGDSRESLRNFHAQGGERLANFVISPPQGADNLRQPRVQITNSADKEIQCSLQGEVLLPNGQSRLLPEASLNLRAGETREVELPPYQFPEQTGTFQFDVRALVNDNVVARLPQHSKLEVHSLSPAPGGSRGLR